MIPDERQRLADLYALRILDTAKEQRFDQYTKLLTTIFQAPIAFISFMSVCGLVVDETPCELSFCVPAVAQGSLLVVEDTLEDERFAGHPSVVGDPNIRFYAGSVIRGPTDKPIGACLRRLLIAELSTAHAD